MEAKRVLSTGFRSRAALGGALAAFIAAACFVDEGDCVSQGVEIEPCASPMRVGQTRTFVATVSENPDEEVNWVATEAIDLGFDVVPAGREIDLIGTLGAGGVYRLRAESAADPERFGETIVTVLGSSYGSLPSPVQVNGTDFPAGYESAVAAGGNRYYVAYADPNQPVARGGGPENFFVKQFDLAANVELETIPNQFENFAQGGLRPNIAADCLGNGYWLDQPDFDFPIQLNRLSPTGVRDTIDLPGFFNPGTLAVSCEGTIYFFAFASTGSDFPELFCVPVFGAAPILFDIEGLGSGVGSYEVLALDPEGRLLLGNRDPVACDETQSAQVLRVIAGEDPGTGTIDEDFFLTADGSLPYQGGVASLAVDSLGVVYVAPIFVDFASDGPQRLGCIVPSTEVHAFNSKGLLVYTIQDYELECPPGCSLDVDLDGQTECGTRIPFQDISGIAVGGLGQLRVIDDVTLGDQQPDACEVTVRLVLVDPN